MTELRQIKDKVNDELEKVKNKEENCNNKLVLSNNKANKFSSELKEKTMDLHVALAILSIVSIILIICIYMLNSN